MERVQNPVEYKEKKDFMNGFLAAKEEYPDLVSDNEIIGYMMLNVRALSFFFLPLTILTRYLRSSAAQTQPPSF